MMTAALKANSTSLAAKFDSENLDFRVYRV